MPKGLSKTDHNKWYYSKNKPYPIRLGIIKEIAMQEAFESEQSLHWCLVKALEKCYWPAILSRAKDSANKYSEILRLVKKEYTLREACVELSLSEKLFIIGISDEQAKEVSKFICKQEQDNLQQKKGYYKYMEPVLPEPAKVYKLPKRVIISEAQMVMSF